MDLTNNFCTNVCVQMLWPSCWIIVISLTNLTFVSRYLHILRSTKEISITICEIALKCNILWRCRILYPFQSFCNIFVKRSSLYSYFFPCVAFSVFFWYPLLHFLLLSPLRFAGISLYAKSSRKRNIHRNNFWWNIQTGLSFSKRMLFSFHLIKQFRKLQISEADINKLPNGSDGQQQKICSEANK